MEVIQASEAFVQREEGLVFDNTKIILRRTSDNQYFYSRTPKRLSSPSAADLEELELVEIPTDHIRPIFHPGLFTTAAQPLPPDIYVKRPSLVDYGDTPASYRLSDHIANEVEVCEILMKHPHPNVAHYLGCIVQHGRVTGLCFVKYDMSLSEALRRNICHGHDGFLPSNHFKARFNQYTVYTLLLMSHCRDNIPLDKERCLRGIEDGVGHLHGLGLIHNDLNPSNIMMQDGDPVIIDFDSCKKEGQELGLKRGAVGWCAEQMDNATRDNDRHGISKIREFLMKGGNA